MKTPSRFLFIPLVVFVLILAALGPTGLITPALADQPAQPKMVVVPGTIQSKLGCAKDWDPACDKTALTYDEQSDVWSGQFEIPAGDYEYKVAINGAWTENYGEKAQKDGPNIKLSLKDTTKVMFIYSHTTHWIADSVNFIVANVPGSFQTTVGCTTGGDKGNWNPACLRTWLQDPDGDGVYVYTAKGIPAGDYEAKVAVNLSWGENYGAKGARDGANIAFTVADPKKDVVFTWDSKSKVLSISVEGAPKGNIKALKAHWVSRNTIAWKPTVNEPLKTVYALHYDPTGSMTLDVKGIIGGETIPLKLGFGLASSIADKFPQLVANGYSSFTIPQDALAKVPDILKGQIAITAADKDGNLLDASGLQIPGVLDDLYTYNGELGISIKSGVPTLRLWAPTAKSVSLHLYDDSKTDKDTVVPMNLDAQSGVWSVDGKTDWLNKFYLYEVNVFVPSTGKFENNLVTDPYSVSLSMNSTRSQIVDLSDPALAPKDWSALKKPTLKNPTDIVLYELHIRDFSIDDASVPEQYRGTFKAFTVPESNGMKHLAALAAAGLTHVHLLPTFDIATIEEDKSKRAELDFKQLAALPADSDQQQKIVAANRDKDGFNWGYDPYHYDAPEGSYSTNPDGSTRIVELREAVQGLSNAGLRVVMDVVYNHTNASGEDPKSVLDQVVPGYYQRLSLDGKVETSTCCQNTASEHNMMEKLMIDSVIMWAKQYKIDGFRFDLMGHHMVSNMVKLRAALDALTLEKDGVDGKSIYVYGEGWNFGEVANDALGKNATQANLAGTGIGTFNDRLRDAVRGGSPFGGQQEQGFATGLFDNANETKQGTADEQKARLLKFENWIRIGLAGNLADYKLIKEDGTEVTGAKIDYNGSPAGYTKLPQENIVYVEAHDNETFFDMVQYKSPTALPMADRVRMQNMGLSIVLLSQGVPFIHAGQDMLRSKSMDRDSYNSGDWFNALDFTYATDGWGRGLPMEDKNKDLWPIIKPLLGNPALMPKQADIMRAVTHTREMLAIRKSSGLFRLMTAEDVESRLKFYNVGKDQLPGLIVMALDNSDGKIDGDYKQIVVLFNATKTTQTYADAAFASADYALHPVQVNSADDAVKTSSYDAGKGAFTVPAYTTAVFVVKK